MDQAAKPILIAVTAILAASMVTLAVRAGDDEATEPAETSAVGEVDSGASDTDQGDAGVGAAPDASPEATAATDDADTDSEAATPDAPDADADGSDPAATDAPAEPETATEPPAPSETAAETPAPGDSTDGDGDVTADADTDVAAGTSDADALDGLDDMPQTGGGALAALGGVLTLGGAGRLIRRR